MTRGFIQTNIGIRWGSTETIMMMHDTVSDQANHVPRESAGPETVFPQGPYTAVLRNQAQRRNHIHRFIQTYCVYKEINKSCACMCMNDMELGSYYSGVTTPDAFIGLLRMELPEESPGLERGDLVGCKAGKPVAQRTPESSYLEAHGT